MVRVPETPQATYGGHFAQAIFCGQTVGTRDFEAILDRVRPRSMRFTQVRFAYHRGEEDP